ncbi:MAG: hypothetical protein JNJ55_09385 [Betaproteobacteria bacterium]|nr:hypothetical protein [Betaproteobacteria bacterium]
MRISDSRHLMLLALLPITGAFAQAPTVSPPVKAEPAKLAGESVSAPDPLFVVHLTIGPLWESAKPSNEQSGFREHSANLARMRTEGVLVMGARYKDAIADKGMIVIRAANREAALKQFDADPMVKGKRFNLDIADFVPFYDGFVARPQRAAAPPGALEKLVPLAGCWFGRNGKLEFREHWMRPAGNLMMGMGRTMSEGKVAGHEAMRLEVDAQGAVTFIAKPAGQTEGQFKLASGDGGRFVFERTGEEFPSRVIYHLKSDGALDASIEGKQNGRDARVEFPMRRASCE